MRIGVDLGGTKIELVALDEDGSERFRRRVPTPQGDYQATLRAIVGLVQDAERAIGLRASVGVGTPGSLSPVTGLIRNANSTCLSGRCAWRTTPTASRCPKPRMAPARARRWCSP